MGNVRVVFSSHSWRNSSGTLSHKKEGKHDGSQWVHGRPTTFAKCDSFNLFCRNGFSIDTIKSGTQASPQQQRIFHLCFQLLLTHFVIVHLSSLNTPIHCSQHRPPPLESDTYHHCRVWSIDKRVTCLHLALTYLLEITSKSSAVLVQLFTWNAENSS